VSAPLREQLEAVEVPDPAGARDRARATVADAFAARRAPRRRRALRAPAIAIGIGAALLAAAVGAGATEPGAAVRGFVVRVLGGERPPAPRAKIGPLPKGKLLVTSRQGTWIVASDGSRRLLGSYTGATWSPRGLYVAAWRGADLSAVAPDGRVAWTLRTPGTVSSAAWSPDGFRVAYRRAGGLGIVAGDGTAPRLLASSVAPAGPAWRPGTPHTLAWVDARGRIVVRDADSGTLVWRSRSPVSSPRGMAWSADGRLLLVPTAGGLLLADPRANRVRAVRLPAGDRAVAAAWAPTGRRLAVVARQAQRDVSRVLVGSAATVTADRPVFETTGVLASPAWSPDGAHVLVLWNEADEWLLVPAPAVPAPAAGLPATRGIVAISPVASRFGGAPTVRGWCCSS
jgi:dipeptidyl aminopeptidase/acylaminoacyl peptidase